MKTTFYLSIAILGIMIASLIMQKMSNDLLTDSAAIQHKTDSLRHLHDAYVDKTDSIQYVLIHDLYEQLNKR